MIRPSYSLKLARTKLRSKRGVLITSIIVASILFAALIAMVIVFTGAEKSATMFVKKAGNDRYLVKTAPNIPFEKISFAFPLKIEDIRAIKAYEKKYYDDLRTRYKSLGIPYDKSIEVPALNPSVYVDPAVPEEQRVMLNYQSPVAVEMQAQKFNEYARTATNKFSDLQKAGESYGATGYYKASTPSQIPSFPSMRLIENGKEDFAAIELRAGNMSTTGYYVNAAYNSEYSLTDQKLLSRYLLTTDVASLKGIPVIISAQEAASLFGAAHGIGKEPESASEKRSWIQTIQQKLNGQTYQTCYRNAAEQELLTKIQRDYADMKYNEKVEGYQKPSLIYQLPTTACGDITVQQDTRSAQEKKAELDSQAAQKKLGLYKPPNHTLLTFQIVGIRYAQGYIDSTRSVSDYVKVLLGSQGDVSSSLDIPIQMYDALPRHLKASDVREEFTARTTRDRSAGDDFVPRVLEFDTVDKARQFLENETCPFTSSGSECSKLYFATPYGSNYLVIDEIGKLFSRIASIAFPSILALAAVIIWFTISRIMAENRKEIAVYRAMGAKRRDIAAIYLTYVAFVALYIAAVAFIVGLAAGFVVSAFYSQNLTDTAVTAFGITDSAPYFSLFSLDSPLLLAIIASIFIVSFVASAQPLIRNVLRSPIRDIREE